MVCIMIILYYLIETLKPGIERLLLKYNTYKDSCGGGAESFRIFATLPWKPLTIYIQPCC